MFCVESIIRDEDPKGHQAPVEPDGPSTPERAQDGGSASADTRKSLMIHHNAIIHISLFTLL